MVLAVIILWPALMFVVPSEWKDSDTYWAERKDTEMEALLESVRQERLAPDPRLAEFDILLGIEPEPIPAPRAPLRIPAVRYENGSPPHVTQGYAYGLEPELDFFVDDTPEFRVRNIQSGYSKGGAIPSHYSIRGEPLDPYEDLMQYLDTNPLKY